MSAAGEPVNPALPEASPGGSAPATVTVVAVQLRQAGQVYDYDSGGLPLRRGDRVLVQTERSNTLGTVAADPRAIAAEKIKEALPRVLKKADRRDLAREEVNLDRARNAQRICLHRIRERRLKMKLIRTDCLFDGSKIIFYFFASDRVDFRDLVRDLSQTLHTRIEMKQIGERDETKMVGALAPCGRELCCSSWLRDFHPVSVKMAKEQGLSLNPAKLAGICGRLKCCLRYEYDTYVKLGKALPAVGSKVESVKGDGVVIQQNQLSQTVTIRLEDKSEVEARLDEILRRKGK